MVGCRILWSIKNKDLILPENNDDLWINEWLPQIEALSHPAVKAMITHCGFGGTLELINAGIPGILWPHFGD